MILDEIASLLQTDATQEPLFELRNVGMDYRLGRSSFSALNEVSLTGYPQETLGIVGESGCGKSTLAKSVLYLQRPTRGRVYFDGHDLGKVGPKKMRAIRKNMQMIFQDPDASLNPRLSVFEHLKEPLEIHNLASKKSLSDKIEELLAMVGLSWQLADKYPYQLSGGQKQRVSIARALSVMPSLLVCDEPLASLDISVSMQIVQLLKELQLHKKLSYLFITHDLTFLRAIAHRIAVLYLGNLVELAPAEALFRAPLHPYTQGLISAIPIPDPEKERKKARVVISGDMPSLLSPPGGCPFHTRCPFVQEVCRHKKPAFLEVKPCRFVACHLY